MRISYLIMAVVLTLTASTNINAQDRVNRLQGLIDVKASDGESVLRFLGYRFIHTEKSGADSYSFWPLNNSELCIIVRTYEERYAAIFHTSKATCVIKGYPRVSAVQREKFASVCGVNKNGGNNSSQCYVVNVNHGARKEKTLLHYPDHTIRLLWLNNSKASAFVDGLVPENVEIFSIEGESSFTLKGNTYYFISNKHAAELEALSFESEGQSETEGQSKVPE